MLLLSKGMNGVSVRMIKTMIVLYSR